MEQIAAADLAAQARSAALAAGQGIQSGAKGAADSLSKFVEGQDERAGQVAGRKQAEPERKDFWDSFGVEKEPAKPSSIGTSAMKKPSGGTQPPKKKEDGWGDDW